MVIRVSWMKKAGKAPQQAVGGGRVKSLGCQYRAAERALRTGTEMPT